MTNNGFRKRRTAIALITSVVIVAIAICGLSTNRAVSFTTTPRANGIRRIRSTSRSLRTRSTGTVSGSWRAEVAMRRSPDKFYFNPGEKIAFDVFAWLNDLSTSDDPNFTPEGSGGGYVLPDDVNIYAILRKYPPSTTLADINSFADIPDRPDDSNLIATWNKGTNITFGKGELVKHIEWPDKTQEGEFVCITVVTYSRGGRGEKVRMCALVMNTYESALHSEAKVNTGAYSDKPDLVAFPGDRVWWRHTADFNGNPLVKDAKFQLHNTYQSQLRDTMLSSGSPFSSTGTQLLLHEGHYIYTNPFVVTDDSVGQTMCESVTGINVARETPTDAELNSSNSVSEVLSHVKTKNAESNKMCVKFPYQYTRESPHMPAQKDCTFYGKCPDNKLPDDYAAGLYIKTHADTDYIMVGDKYHFYNVVEHRGGRTKSKDFRIRGYLVIIKGAGVNKDNQAGPIIYPTINFDELGCKANSKYKHGVDSKNIKYCEVLCKHVVDNDPKTPCVDTVPGLKPGGKRPYWYDGYLTRRLFDSAHVELGDKVCEWGAITDWQVVNGDSAPSIMASNMACIDIAKIPQMRILGGDSIATGGIFGARYNTSNDANIDRGSWSQYGLFAGDSIRNFGSAGFTIMQDNPNPLLSNRYRSCFLNFANKGAIDGSECDTGADLLGHFGIDKDSDVVRIPVVNDAAILTTTRNDIRYVVDDRDKYAKSRRELVHRYVGSEKTFSVQGILAPGVNIVLEVPDGVDVIISGDIGLSDYNGNPVAFKDMKYRQLGDVPTLNIIAHGNIMINGNVKQIYGNLVARKKIYTCAESKPGLNVTENPALGGASACNQQLTVYGSLISSEGVELHRTAGSSPTSDKAKDASETIIYTPTSFLMPSSNLDSSAFDYRIIHAEDLVARY